VKAPKTSQELFERALALHRSGQPKEAEPLYRKVISRSAQHDRALFGLSVILLEAGRLEESKRYLERAVDARPDEPKYLTNLGEIHRHQGNLELAARLFERAVTVDPDHPEARRNLAVTLMMVGAHAQALRQLERAVALRPDNAFALMSLAWVLLQLERPKEAALRARHAIELDPLLATAYRSLGDAQDMLCDKPGAIASYRRCVELSPLDYRAHSNLIVALYTDPSSDERTIFAETRSWAERHAEPLRKFLRPHANDTQPERRLRIGYVSPDFRAHPVQQFLVPLFQHHDRSAVELFLYSSVERPDAETAWYRALAGAQFREIQHLDDVQAAELVRRDEIDILIDLALHSAGSRLRLFSCKPAPVQMTWLGYVGTTGLDTIDYRITDPFCDPPGSDLSVYSEESIHLPASFWSYDALQADLPEGPLPALANGSITFGCQNSPRKLHAGVLALWARVLREVPGSRLFLHLPEYAREAVLQMLASEGIQAERVEFGGRVSRREYLERYQRIDIALDTFPYAGGTTSLDALWMGVPVITLSGARPVQRAGVSLAMNLGLPELIATSEPDFVDKAAELARDLGRLSRLRSELRTRLVASPVGDTARFARDLEAAYRGAWRRYCSSGA
jgi:predicted O-linked N-acetylglucosamine transferase (SPINDLY family)